MNRLAMELIRCGVDITPQAITHLEKRDSKGMQVRALCGLRLVAGVDWEEFGGWLDEEFGENLSIK